MKLSRLLVGFGCIAITAVVRADAPAGQYAPFDKDNTTIVDNFTGLTWQRNATGAATWLGAKLACSGMGMRLPTLKELLTLVDENPHVEYIGGMNVSKMIDRDAFPNANVAQPYWTQTPAQRTSGVTTKAFAVDFSTGLTATGVSDGNSDVQVSLPFRCVK